MDEIKGPVFGDAGELPDTLRALVRRKRAARRARSLGLSAVVLAAFALGGLALMRDAHAPALVEQRAVAGGVIGIDDPMFDGLVRPGSFSGDLQRWRAGAGLGDGMPDRLIDGI